jgi:hypothetical protein
VGHDGRPQPSAQRAFTQLSSAITFQAAALARPSVVRADLMVLLNSSSKPEAVAPSLPPAELAP